MCIEVDIVDTKSFLFLTFMFRGLVGLPFFPFLIC